MLPVATIFKTVLSLTLVLPLLIIAAGPVLLILLLAVTLRLFVWILAKFFRRDLAGFVTGINSMFATKNSSRAAVNIVVVSIMKGKLSREQILESIEKRVLQLRDPETKALLYERLQMSWTSFLGYAFWKRDTNFDLNNHVRLYDYGGNLSVPDPCSKSDLRKVLPGITDAPWDRSRSPWEILVIPIFLDKFGEEEEMNTAMILRVDHILGDGYSILRFLEVISQTQANLPELKFAKREFSIWKKVGLLLKMPWDLVQMVGIALLHTPLGAGNGFSKEEMIMSFSPAIDVKTVKVIKNHFGVSYATVIHAALFGAIGKALKESGQRAPRHLLAAFILPTQEHSRGLSVNLSGMLAAWPITPCSPEENIRRVQKIMKTMSQSTTALALPALVKVAAVFPMFVRNILTIFGSSRASVLITNFPVATGPNYFEGCEYLDCSAVLGAWSRMGILVINGGANNKQTISFSVNKSIFLSQDVTSKLGSYVQQEFQAMLSAAVV